MGDSDEPDYCVEGVNENNNSYIKIDESQDNRMVVENVVISLVNDIVKCQLPDKLFKDTSYDDLNDHRNENYIIQYKEADEVSEYSNDIHKENTNIDAVDTMHQDNNFIKNEVKDDIESKFDITKLKCDINSNDHSSYGPQIKQETSELLVSLQEKTFSLPENSELERWNVSLPMDAEVSNVNLPELL